jgi:hypothetical protein
MAGELWAVDRGLHLQMTGVKRQTSHNVEAVCPQFGHKAVALQQRLYKTVACHPILTKTLAVPHCFYSAV